MVIDPVERVQIDACLVMGERIVFCGGGVWGGGGGGGNIKQSRDCSFREKVSFSLSEAPSLGMFFTHNNISVKFR